MTVKRGFMPDEAAASPERARAAYERQPHDAASTPKDLKLKLKEQRLTVDWSDGLRSDFALAELRRRCPCAGCRTERESQDTNPLKVLKADPTNVRVTHGRLVGRYAIQLVWSDGHNTGIFDFRFLRSLGAASTPTPITNPASGS